MTEKIKKLVEEIENLTLIELNELVKTLEEKFGIQSIPSVPFAEVQQPAEAAATTAPANVNLILVDSGPNKIQVIKVLREINPNLGLKDAKDIVDNPPKTIKENISIEEAGKIKEKLEAAGAKVELK